MMTPARLSRCVRSTSQREGLAQRMQRRESDDWRAAMIGLTEGMV
jgi:hypothetical protein